jgi:TatD DNase family protein
MNEGTIALVDSHVHLQDAVFAPDLAGVLRQAAVVGVRHFVCNGSSEEDWLSVEMLAREHSAIIPCFGLHPWYVRSRSPDWSSHLEAFLARTHSGVGEIGLDRWIEPRDEPAQEEVFRIQLALARQWRRPVMIHCLRAWGWLIEVLDSESLLPAGFMIHAYGGAPELIPPLVKKGAYFSFAGSVLHDRKLRQRESLRRVPPERLLLETDAPDLLPPETHRPFELHDPEGNEKNHPANLGAILAGIAQILKVPADALAQRIWENSRRFLTGLL